MVMICATRNHNRYAVNQIADNCDAMPTIAYELTGATTASGSSDASGATFAKGTTHVLLTLSDARSFRFESVVFVVSVQERLSVLC